jgi:hypothetical protein
MADVLRSFRDGWSISSRRRLTASDGILFGNRKAKTDAGPFMPACGTTKCPVDFSHD